jgi:hypothetical protein
MRNILPAFILFLIFTIVLGVAQAQSPYAGPLGTNSGKGGFSWPPYAGGLGGGGGSGGTCNGKIDLSQGCTMPMGATP